MTDVAGRFLFVLNGTSFPVDRWELIARAEDDGADATTLRELHDSEQHRYVSLSDIIDAIDRFPPQTHPALCLWHGAAQRRDLR
jgi:hypothetical protein